MSKLKLPINWTPLSPMMYEQIIHELKEKNSALTKIHKTGTVKLTGIDRKFKEAEINSMGAEWE